MPDPSEDLTEVAITWKHTGDGEFPYTAEVRGRPYTIRINDFPAEPLYTLLSEGVELTDLEDWPPAWSMPAPPKALLDMLRPRLEGAVRLAATNGPGDAVEPHAFEDQKASVGPDGERILALAPETGVAISAVATESGDEVRLHTPRTATKRVLAVGQRHMLAASISPNGRCAILLDEEGRVLCYDLSTSAYPGSARARKPERGKRASIDLAPGGRLWIAAAGSSIEVRMMNDDKALATVDLSSLADEVTGVRFLPDASGFLVSTARGNVMRFALLLDRVASSRDARVAVIADAVDAALAGTRWIRYAPRVEVYDERTESGRTTLYFVADRYEYHSAQSGSDWAEHDLCAGHATFEGERRVEAQVSSTERRRLTEREAEDYDSAATLAAFRAETARARSSSTVVPGADAIRRAFDVYFASYRMALPEHCLHRRAGKFSDNGWDVSYRFGEEHGAVYLDVYAENRRTNERLYRVHADGRVDLVGASTEGVLEDEDRAFYAEVQRRFS